MTSPWYGAVLCLLVLSVAAAPTDREETQDEQDETVIGFEDQMFLNVPEEEPNDTAPDDAPEIVFSGNPAPSETSANREQETGNEEVEESSSSSEEVEEEDEEDGLTDYSDYGSLPSWYVKELLGNGGDSNESQVDTYMKYKTELDELILDVKLYQVYHSIKTLKRVLDDLIAEERLEEAELIRQGAGQGNDWRTGDVEMGGVDPAATAGDPPVSLFTKQLGALKSKEVKPRRAKRDLSWGDDSFDWNDERPNNQWLMKYDDDDDVTGYDVKRKNDDLDDEFSLTKEQIEELISTFLDDDNSPYYKNDVNINLGQQRMKQVVYPNKRALHQNRNSEFVARLPTLEGMRKRGPSLYPQYRRSGYKRGLPAAYRDDLPASPPNDQALLRYQVSKLARRLAANNRRQPANNAPDIQDFTNGPAGDINMWFENNPKYTIGIDDNIGDTYGLMELANLPRTSPDEIGALYNDRGRLSPARLGKRGRIVEEPSLPGPYAGYFMEGQLLHELFNKRSPPSRNSSPVEVEPKTLQLSGPNAWGNFIFLGDDSDGAGKAGELLSQSFGDDIGGTVEERSQPTKVEMEGMWLDGDDDDGEKSSLTEDEKKWVRRILGYDD